MQCPRRRLVTRNRVKMADFPVFDGLRVCRKFRIFSLLRTFSNSTRALHHIHPRTCQSHETRATSKQWDGLKCTATRILLGPYQSDVHGVVFAGALRANYTSTGRLDPYISIQEKHASNIGSSIVHPLSLKYAFCTPSLKYAFCPHRFPSRQEAGSLLCTMYNNVLGKTRNLWRKRTNSASSFDRTTRVRLQQHCCLLHEYPVIQTLLWSQVMQQQYNN